MLPHLKQVRKHTLLTGLIVVLASTFLACSFEAPLPAELPKYVDDLLNDTPILSLTAGDRWTVYEEPGKIRVQHGFGCTQASFAATEDYIGFRIQDKEAVPLEFGDAGTIIMNGWDLTFTEGDDHHVQVLSSAIFNVTSEVTPTQFELSWNAGGVLSDKNGDDDFRWCYRYTLVFWNSSVFDAMSHNTVFDQDVGKDLNIVFAEYLDEAGGTALLDIPGEFTVPQEKSEPRAVLPRGIGLGWLGAGNDHHVLQVGFDLGTPPLGGTPVIVGDTIAWTSQTILKDNDKAYDYMGSEVVNILSGQSIHMWQPRSVLHLKGMDWVEEPTQLILKPAEPSGVCLGNGQEEHLKSYAVERVPYDYAIPVLTGWNMQYQCTDHEVERIGVYLVEFEYVKDPNAPTGTLHYTIFSTMRDDSDNGHDGPKYKVSVLGLNELGGSSEK